jgi:hypothetical protein
MSSLQEALAQALATLPAGHELLTGQRTLAQLSEPGFDPDDPARLLQEAMEASE